MTVLNKTALKLQLKACLIPLASKFNDLIDSLFTSKDSESLINYNNLLIQWKSATSLSIYVDGINVEGDILQNILVDNDITGVGANKLDAGVVAINTFYYLYVITKGDGTFASLSSLSDTAPTMPAGYTNKKRVGAFYTDGAANVEEFKQVNGFFLFMDVFGKNVLSNGNAIAFTDVDFSPMLPKNINRVYISAYQKLVHSAAGVNFQARLRQNGGTATGGQLALNCVTQVNNVEFENDIFTWVDTDSNQLMEYKLNLAPDVSGGFNVAVMGWEDNI